jgi:hypothetical protein
MIYSRPLTSQVSSFCFKIDKTTCALYVSADSYKAYRTAPEWDKFGNIIEE